MDWPALAISLKLAFWTTILLIPLGMVIARAIAWRRFAAKGFVEALIALPLVLPPTVLGYYLLTLFSKHAALGSAYQSLFNAPLAFSFEGLLLASLIFNVPFAIQPMQRAFEAMPRDVREAAWCSGLSHWRTFLRIELPLAWTGVLTATILTFAHTLGEFGVVLMVGGNIPGETKTIAIAIYDRVQAFDDQQAATMSALLLTFSFVAIGFIYFINDRFKQRPQ
ncbi:MAG: molybdate ABC transporter permease subunit [Arenicellales bacterium]|nr:molybdate ABC transporter permease subunit [Arenicellales bacterium]